MHKSLSAPTCFPVIEDHWSLDPGQRQQFLLDNMASQQHWLHRLPTLVEPPFPGQDFPAFLLDTEPFAALGQSIRAAEQHKQQLDTATADALQRFVDLYQNYLSADAPDLETETGWVRQEDIFPQLGRA